MRALQAAVLFFLLLSGLTAAAAPPPAYPAINYFVAQKQSRPFQIEDNGSNQHGMITELLQQIATRLKLTINYHTLPFRRYRRALQDNKTPRWITYGAPHWAAPQSTRLGSESITTIRHSLLSSSRLPAPEVHSADDLCGSNLVLIDGFYYPQLETALNNGCIHAFRVRSHKAAFLFVDRNAPPSMFLEMTYRIRYNRAQEQWPAGSFILTDISAIIPPYDLHFAYSEDMPQTLIDHMNEELRRMKKNGELEAIIGRYQN